MTEIRGLAGFNKSDLTTKLIASYGNDLVNVDTGVGYRQNITPDNNAEFETFLDNLFFTNFYNPPRNFNGTVWDRNLVRHLPFVRYYKRWRNRLYAAYVKLPGAGGFASADLEAEARAWYGTTIENSLTQDGFFPSRVIHTDVPSTKDDLKWGIYWGENAGTRSGADDNKIFINPISKVGFKDVGLKAGDPFYVLYTDKPSTKYTILSVDSNFQLTTLETVKGLGAIGDGRAFWAGSNWFDVNTDDGDYITGLGENNDRLMVFKLNSLHRYDGNSLRQVKGCPGTNSHRSIQNVKDSYTIYFHGSSGNKTGFYLYDGVNSKKISNAFEKHIAGIAASFFDQVVAWTEGDLYRAYIGDLTNTNFGISMTDAVWTFDITTNTQSIDPIGKVIKASAQLRESGAVNTYIGDDDSSVFLTGTESVFAYDTGPINFEIHSHPHYPQGTENVLDFTRIQIIARNARGMKVQYKLFNALNTVDEQWNSLGEIYADKSEFVFPVAHRKASGIAIRFLNSSTKEPDLLIEKYSLFYRVEGTQYVQLS